MYTDYDTVLPNVLITSPEQLSTNNYTVTPVKYTSIHINFSISKDDSGYLLFLDKIIFYLSGGSYHKSYFKGTSIFVDDVLIFNTNLATKTISSGYNYIDINKTVHVGDNFNLFVGTWQTSFQPPSPSQAIASSTSLYLKYKVYIKQPIYVNDQQISQVFVNDVECKTIYLNDEKVFFPPIEPETNIT